MGWGGGGHQRSAKQPRGVDNRLRPLAQTRAAQYSVHMAKRIREVDLYPRIARWLKSSYGCFKTTINLGLKHSRVDVLGIRDTGGDLSGDVETIAIEVKRGGQPFATTSGQTRGYSVYANRVYLAELREAGFTRDEMDIASALGVGLIHIASASCREVLSSPKHDPIPKLQLRVFERMGYGKCCICQCIFAIGTGESDYSRTNLSEAGIVKAAHRNKGLAFWNHSVSERKLGVRKKGNAYERRFICSDCVANLFPSRAK